MKKTIALSFILLANIVLLAHAVVPHHDHDDMTICFLTSHCEDHDAAHCSADCDTQTHQDDACSDKCCLIDNAFILTETKVKIHCHVHVKCDCLHTLYVLISNTLDLHDCVDDTLCLYLYTPYLVACHSDYISQSLGLRAPPTC